MGYKGKGLGKDENGIEEPIRIRVLDATEEPNWHKVIYIASDSMLNKIDAERLSKKFDVKIYCHGGCTIKCMYTHLPKISESKPDYVIFHISTNDCTTKTSDEILNEINTLVRDVNKLLPSSKIIISQPITRSDNKTANQIIINLNKKLKHSNHILLDNTNLNFSHLGKNIISLMKGL